MEKSRKLSRTIIIDRLKAEMQRGFLGINLGLDLLEFLQGEQLWKDEVLEALLQSGAYRNEFESDPKAAVQALIKQEVDMALDPAISERARRLLHANPPTVPAGYSYTAELLNQKIPFTSHNNGAHLIVEGPEGYIDFWPGTGRWNNRKGIAEFGLQTLLKYLKGDPL